MKEQEDYVQLRAIRLLAFVPRVVLMLLAASFVHADAFTVGTVRPAGNGECFPFNCEGPEYGRLIEFQQQYLKTAFPSGGPIEITSMTFFDELPYNGVSDAATFDVYLSTDPNSFGHDSSTLSNNIGADNKLFATFTYGPTTPASFTITGDFTYNPSLGDLMMTVFDSDITSNGFTFNAYLAADGVGDVTLDNYQDPTGTQINQGGGLVTEFNLPSQQQNTTPEPTSLLLMATGLVLTRLRKRG